MSYIYKITNDINNKIYIGKTEFSIEKRFKEHCQDSKKGYTNRPLYNAMNKYGIEHFNIELIEECNNPEEREKYWIEYYRSFKYGYNATLGGDGKRYLDYDLIIATYLELNSIIDTAKKLNISEDSIHNILINNNIKIRSSAEINKEKYGVLVNQYNLKGEFIQTFLSLKDALIFLGKDTGSHGAKSHISDVCKGKRKTAYGYIWRYAK